MNRDEVRLERERRHAVREQFGELFPQVASILFRLDPIRINYKVNTDEYEPEAGTILPRLEQVSTKGDAHQVIHQEFVRWFGERIAGPPARYQQAAEEIWSVWLEWKAKQAA